MTDQPLTLRDIALKASDRFGGARGRALGREADKAGVKIVYTTIDKIIAGTYRSRPTDATLEALAELALVPVEDVYRAAEQPIPQAPFRDLLPDGVDALDAGQREAVLAVIRQMVAANEAAHHSRLEHTLVTAAAAGEARTLWELAQNIAEADEYDEVLVPPEPAVEDNSIEAQADRIHRVFGANFGAMLTYLKRRENEGRPFDPGVELELRRRWRANKVEFEGWDELAEENASHDPVSETDAEEARAEAEELLRESGGGEPDGVLQQLRDVVANGDMTPEHYARLKTALLLINAERTAREVHEKLTDRLTPDANDPPDVTRGTA